MFESKGLKDRDYFEFNLLPGLVCYVSLEKKTGVSPLPLNWKARWQVVTVPGGGGTEISPA